MTMFNPLGAVLTALQSYFLLGERLYMGRYNHQCYIHFQEPHTHKGLDGSNLIYDPFRILGAVVVIIGLYLVLWGKEGDQNHIKFQEKTDLTNGCFHFYFFTCFA